MKKASLLLSFIFSLLVFQASAQRTVGDELLYLKEQVKALTRPEMMGRGYVNGGRDSAGLYVLKQFKKFKLQPVAKKGPYAQAFAFPVNTFPGKMELTIDGKVLQPGEHFIIDPSSSSFSGQDMEVKKVNLGKIKTEEEWKQTLASFDTKRIYYLENVDGLCELLELQKAFFATDLPAGCYIIPKEGRLNWGVSRETMPATVFYVKEDNLPKKLKSVTVEVTAQYIDHAHCENIVACAPGKVKDSFVVFTTHYDHVGAMGDSFLFAGANDNASGVAMLLSLASYYSTHPQHYSILFIAFSGQTAGLMGSEFFRFHPMVPLANIRFLVDLGMVGDAANGITVVNATEYQHDFDLLYDINKTQRYLPAIVPKGPAANSDQYHFAKAGVPCFFIYANGGKGYYHDFQDGPKEVTFENASALERLLTDFVRRL